MGTSTRVVVSLRAYRRASIHLGDSPSGSVGETSTTTPRGAEPFEIIIAIHVEEATHRPGVAGQARALLRPITEAAKVLSRVAAALVAWFGG
jgi:hypothetical protein